MRLIAGTDNLDDATFDGFRQLILAASGISLQPGKEALVLARVAKRMRALGLIDPRAYLAHVEADATGAELVTLLDAIATNVTSFFREADHFTMLAEAFRGWRSSGQQRFRLWSAACSSGEEPYTIAMVLHEACGGQPVDFRVLATDLSTKILERAQRGLYTASALEPVPQDWRVRHFDRQSTADGEPLYSVKPALRERVLFRRLNLAAPPFPLQGPLDAVFVRNVMIYFDRETRQQLVAEAARLLKPGGYLFCGHAESLTGLSTSLQTVRPSVYRKP